jgi:hypothetical protein
MAVACSLGAGIGVHLAGANLAATVTVAVICAACMGAMLWRAVGRNTSTGNSERIESWMGQLAIGQVLVGVLLIVVLLLALLVGAR